MMLHNSVRASSIREEVSRRSWFLASFLVSSVDFHWIQRGLLLVVAVVAAAGLVVVVSVASSIVLCRELVLCWCFVRLFLFLCMAQLREGQT